MDFPPVTLCIPSNRPLTSSREPLSSALSYAQGAGYLVVISDNSRDPQKADFLRGRPNLVLLENGPLDGAQNMLRAFEAASTDFVLPLGDDDFIAPIAGKDRFDFKALDGEYVGVKPHIEVFSAASGTIRINDFSLDGSNASDRMMQYATLIRGDNSSYYSFFRRSEFLSLCKLFVGFHPLKSGISDWSMVLALAASGKWAHDPSTRLRYNLGRWEKTAGIEAAHGEIIAKAGLPSVAKAYIGIFHFLDCFVFVLRHSSLLPLTERHRAAKSAAILFLRGFLRSAYQRPEDFPLCADILALFIEAMSRRDPDLDLLFALSIKVADRLKPGLKAGYEAFLQAGLIQER